MEVVQFLIDYMGADKEWRDNQGNTPLLIASNADTVQVGMIRCGGSASGLGLGYDQVCVRYSSGVTGGVYRFLVDDMRVDISVVNHDGWGAMHLAARRGCPTPTAQPLLPNP